MCNPNVYEEDFEESVIEPEPKELRQGRCTCCGAEFEKMAGSDDHDALCVCDDEGCIAEFIGD